MKVVYQLLLMVMTFTIASMNHIQAQEAEKDKYWFQAKLLSGYPGLLAIDELTQGKEFERKAAPPVALQLDFYVTDKFSVGYYAGYEYEKQSGTIVDFAGPNYSFLTGFLVDWHLIKSSHVKWIDPYFGVNLYLTKISGRNNGKFDTPIGIRIGANFPVKDNFGLNLNTGFGVALVEAGLTYSFFK